MLEMDMGETGMENVRCLDDSRFEGKCGVRIEEGLVLQYPSTAPPARLMCRSGGSRDPWTERLALICCRIGECQPCRWSVARG